MALCVVKRDRLLNAGNYSSLCLLFVVLAQRQHFLTDDGLINTQRILCPFAVYYLRYGVRSFFTMYRIPPADGKTAGQKVQCKIAVAVQKVKTFVLFIPLF